MDLATAERLTSAADPKGLAVLKKQSNDPAAAKAVAGQFGALLMQGVMQGSDGAALSMTGDGVGGNIVSSMFANAISHAAMSGDKLGLADLLFRSIEAKQRTADPEQEGQRTTVPQARAAESAAPPARAPADGFPLAPYWQGNGLRPLVSKTTRGNFDQADSAGAAATFNPGRSGSVVSMSQPSPTMGWSASPGVMNLDANTSRTTASEQVKSFSQQLGPLLQQAGQQLGVSPRILLAQAALETGWGRSVVGNNVFGIKAGSSWQGSEVTTTTHEVEAGQMVPRQASFRAYPSLDAAVQDYVALIANSKRYRSVMGAGDDAAAYARGLVTGGYATDTEYAQKLEAIAAAPSTAATFAAPSRPIWPGPFATRG
jgi:flagellar protein FlgJ